MALAFELDSPAPVLVLPARSAGVFEIDESLFGELPEEPP